MEQSRFVKLDLLPRDAAGSPNKAAEELNQLMRFVGFRVEGDPRLPWRFARSLVLAGLNHDPVLLRPFPVGDRW